MESPGVQTATFKNKLDNYLRFQRKDISFFPDPQSWSKMTFDSTKNTCS